MRQRRGTGFTYTGFEHTINFIFIIFVQMMKHTMFIMHRDINSQVNFMSDGISSTRII